MTFAPNQQFAWPWPGRSPDGSKTPVPLLHAHVQAQPSFFTLGALGIRNWPTLKKIISCLIGKCRENSSSTKGNLLLEPKVDLAAEDDAFLLKAYATSRSRLFLELSTSGAVSIAWAMCVPVLRCNCVSIVGPLDSSSIVLTKHIIRPDGSRMSMREMLDRKGISDVAMKEVLQPQGFQYESNGLAELKAATWKIFSVTADCLGWRSAATVKPHAPTNRVELPLARGYQHIIADHDTGDSVP